MKVRLRPLATTELIDAERHRRLAIGIPFGAGRIQVRDSDRSFIYLAMTAARLAIDAGSKPGDYRWQDPAQDFEWITADNTHVKMDAQSVVEVALSSLMYMTQLGLIASRLKSRIRSGENIDNVRRDIYWTTE